MKGMFLHQQIEYRLEVVGEEFVPGTELKCSLSVKNHSAASHSLEGLYLRLGLGDIKRMAAKHARAIEPLSDANLVGTGVVESGGTKSFEYTFSLDLNAPVTEKSQSLFLFYGIEGEDGIAGELRVLVVLHPHAKAIVELLESHFQFVYKGAKSAKGWTLAKFKPPSARKFSLVNELSLCTCFGAEALEVKYLFNTKKFNASESSLSVSKDTSEVVQRFEPKEYLLTGGFFNHDFVMERVEEALATVATGI